MRAKFVLQSITRTMDYQNREVHTLRFAPVADGKGENKQFWEATPSGSLELGCVNADAVAGFELTGEYYLDITPA